MVMKKDGRKRDIKSKLVAAVCMLLVSCIMMVSSTYAWFTLSTAPEVKGISTSVGSNGNLEIALSPADGDGTKVGDYAIGADVNDWVAKNQTWGNLLDLSNYADLKNWTLSPSQLVLNNGKLPAFPLAIPEYGSDGRITSLNMTSATFGDYKADGTGTNRGVRPVGSASGLSLQASQLKVSLADINKYAEKAVEAASDSLNKNGQALASIMVQHAQAGANDTANNYAAFVPALQQLTGDLDQSVVYIKEALRAALIVAACTEKYESEAAFEAAVNAIKNGDIDTMLGKAPVSSYADGVNAVATKVGDAKEAADDLPTAEGSTVRWSDVTDVMTVLMNTTGVKISGYTVEEVKAHMNDVQFLLGLATNCRIELGAAADGTSSGVYYDIAEIAGNITASTTATLDGSSVGLGPVTLENVIITTTYTGTTKLTTLHNGLKDAEAGDAETGTAVIDTFYGYIIDFMFRTNAADSKLLLQTDGTQRVYDDSSNTATQGAGSTFTFTTTNAKQVATLKGMVEALRVVFFEPNNSGNVLGIAKATTVVVTEVTDNGTTTYTITGKLALCSYTPESDGRITVGNELAVDDTTTKNFDESDVLTTLGQNVATAVSAMVYLDGSDLSNADMLTSGEVEGTLNLQFASSAELVPMNNNDLYQGTTPANP